ncbi:hypothetical protein BG000_003060 [Podila horticola]|nr:hypothetical protein BG000_003060 [Podila horticola]
MGLIVNILLISVAVFILIRWFFEPPRPQIHFLMVGLEGAGKSSLLVKSEVGQVITSTLVPGFIFERANYKNVTFYSWDLTPETIQMHYKIDLSHVQCLIFVIDSTDRDAIRMSSEYLDTMMRSPALRKAHVLVFANKQDLSGAQSTDNIAESLMLKDDNDRRCHIQGSSSLSGDGILDGLRWIFLTMKEKELRANNAKNDESQTK